MSASFSTLAKNGSHISSSGSSTSLSLSSSNQIFRRFRTFTLPTWLQESWGTHTIQYERIATGTLRLGMAVLAREMMEMHIQHAPDVRGMLDCLPVADREDAIFIGWRKKLLTWPVQE